MGNSANIPLLYLQTVFDFLSKNIWPLIILSFLFICRESISELVKRIISFDFSFGDAKGGIKVSDTSYQKEEKEKIELDVTESVGEEPEKLRDETKENWFSEMYKAFSNRESDKAKEIFDSYCENEKDPVEIEKHKACFYYYQYTMVNDSSALEKLSRLRENLENPESLQHITFWLFMCHNKTKSYKEEERILKEAIENTSLEKYKPNYIVWLALCLKNQDRTEEGLEIMYNQINKVETREQKAEIYKTIATLENKMGNTLREALAYEKLVECRPNDDWALFKAAYSQSEAELSYLCINNYDTLLQFDKDDLAATNNLGVQADRIGLKSIAAGFYRKAVEEKHTLAMANFADSFINQGLLEEAEEILDDAIKQEDPHPNVAIKLSKLNEMKKKENDDWRKAIQVGKKYQNFIRSYADACLNPTDELKQFAGKWTLTDGQIVDIKQDGSNISANWEKKSENALNPGTYVYNISGKTQYRSAIISYTEEFKRDKPALTLLSSMYDRKKEIECLSYINEGGKKLYIMEKNKKDPFELKFYKQ